MRSRRRWIRVSLGLLLALLASAALLVWLQRDFPRRRIERLLATELGARVELARLEILGVERFVLHDIEIREMAARPWLARLRVERVDVRGTVGEILSGRYRDVRLSGVEAVLAPSDVEAVPIGAAAVRVDRLTVERGRVVVAAGGAQAELDVTGQLLEIGGAMQGRLELRSPGFSLAPIAALLGNPGGVDPRGAVGTLAATMRFTDDRIELDARSESTSIETDGRRVELPGLSLVASATWRDDGTIRLELDPELPGIEASAVSVLLGADGSLRQGEASLRGMDLETVSAFLLQLPDETALDGRADLTLRSPRPDQVDFDLHAELRRLRHPDPTFGADAKGIALSAIGTLELELRPYRMRRAAYRLRGRADGARVESGDDVDLALRNVALEVEGQTELPSLFTTYEGRAELGELSGRLGRLAMDRPLRDLELRGSGETGNRSLAGRVALDAAGLGVAGIHGTIAFEPSARGALDWSLQGVAIDRLIAFARERGLSVPEWIAAAGELAAAGTMTGALGAPEVRGTIELGALSVAPTPAGDWSFSGGSATLDFVWPDPDEPIQLSSMQLGGQARLAPLDAVPVTLRGRTTVDPRGGTARLSLPRITLGDLAIVEIDGDWNRSDRTAGLAVSINDVSIARLRTFLRPWIGVPFPEFDLGGGLAARLDASWEAQRGLRGTGTASLTDSVLAHRDGSRVIQGLNTRWKLDFGTGREGDGSVWLDATAPVDGFLLLLGALFGDYSAWKGRLDLHVERTSPRTGWTGGARLQLDDATELRASLRAAPAQPPTYEVFVTMDDLGRTFERWVHDPLAGSLPVLDRMEAGGALTARLSGLLSRTERTVEGRVEVRDGRLEGMQGRVFVRGLQLELPVDLRFHDGAGGTALDEGRPHRGRLEFDRVGFGDVELEQTATDLFVIADSVGLEEGLAMPFLDGVLVFEELTVRDMLQPAPTIESGLLLSGIRLDTLSEALGIVPLDGTAEGYFPRLRLTDGRLEVDGDGKLAVFGGTLTIRDIAGDNLMSRFPELTFSADFEEIDLLQVTHTFDFGDMSGVLEGEIDRCELFRWTPVRFSARFETVRRKGVPQTIHVKAINNIAILGTGGVRPGVLDRGLHRFLDRYTYSKLGVTMTLDNDAFVLRGLERRGSRELFLKGKLPFSIQVVNVQPGRSIGFRSMLERVKRLDFTVGPAGER